MNQGSNQTNEETIGSTGPNEVISLLDYLLVPLFNTLEKHDYLKRGNFYELIWFAPTLIVIVELEVANSKGHEVIDIPRKYATILQQRTHYPASQLSV